MPARHNAKHRLKGSAHCPPVSISRLPHWHASNSLTNFHAGNPSRANFFVGKQMSLSDPSYNKIIKMPIIARIAALIFGTYFSNRASLGWNAL